MALMFVNQDENRVYFRIKNRINGYTSSVIDLSNEDLLSMGVISASKLLEAVHNKSI